MSDRQAIHKAMEILGVGPQGPLPNHAAYNLDGAIMDGDRAWDATCKATAMRVRDQIHQAIAVLLKAATESEPHVQGGSREAFVAGMQSAAERCDEEAAAAASFIAGAGPVADTRNLQQAKLAAEGLARTIRAFAADAEWLAEAAPQPPLIESNSPACSECRDTVSGCTTPDACREEQAAYREKYSKAPPTAGTSEADHG